MIAASTDEVQSNAVVIDHDGDDVYQLDMGSGGAGFGGLGILFDAKGNDVYIGARLTQGAAIGGPASSSTGRELIAPAPQAPCPTARWPGTAA